MPGKAGTQREKIRRQFSEPRLSPRSIPFYTARRKIIDFLFSEKCRFNGRVLDVGCGFSPYKNFLMEETETTDYIGIDLADSRLYSHGDMDVIWDGKTFPFETESFDGVLATEFLEHHAFTKEVLSEMYRVLRPTGTLIVTVPFLWNLHEIPNDHYRFTPYSLRHYAEVAGFDEIEIIPLSGWNASLAQMIGLWIEFSISKKVFRDLAKVLIFPFYALLVMTDRAGRTFDERKNSMFTGLGLIARKPS